MILDVVRDVAGISLGVVWTDTITVTSRDGIAGRNLECRMAVLPVDIGPDSVLDSLYVKQIRSYL